jgi:hypothetical protein
MSSHYYENFEFFLTTRLGWPAWALRTNAVLIFLLVLASAAQYLLTLTASTDYATLTSTQKNASHGFRLFQVKYLTVYLIIMLADWLQGTNMYTLYSVSFICSFAICNNLNA